MTIRPESDLIKEWTLRAIVVKGSPPKAARSLRIGVSTIYRRLDSWGLIPYSIGDISAALRKLESVSER